MPSKRKTARKPEQLIDENNRLKEQIREAGGIFCSAEQIDPVIENLFLKNVLAVEAHLQKEPAGRPPGKAFAEIEANSDFIPGIYNYCDRWCERCHFSARCRTFAMEKEFEAAMQGFPPVENDSHPARLEEILEELDVSVVELSLPPDTDEHPWDECEAITDARRRRATHEQHECSLAARLYSDWVRDWMSTSKQLIEEMQRQSAQASYPDNPDDQHLSMMSQIAEAIEVIYWYQHQIYVKIMRALMSRQCEWHEEDDSFPRDSDGSAKVALIAVDRSISAWQLMEKQFGDADDSIFNMLIQLDALRRNLEKTFPDARAFVRPGFDE